MNGTDNTEQERSINTLYLGHVDNDSGYSVFKLDIKLVISINRVVVIPTSQIGINQINKVGFQRSNHRGFSLKIEIV